LRKLLNLFYHFLYHTFACTYDFVAAIISVGRWQDWRRTVISHIHGQRLLEIGCGSGHLLVELNMLGYQAFGLDESPQMSALTLRNLRANRIHPLIIRGLSQCLPFAQSSLDCVISTFPSEYITDARTLAELRRVIRPGGRLIVVPMAWITGSSLSDQMARWLYNLTGQTTTQTDSLEMRLRQLFNKAGFRSEISKTEIRHSTVLVVVAENPY